MAIETPGRSDEATIEEPDERSRVIALPPQSGKTTILVASGATWDKSEDLQATLRSIFVQTRDKTVPELFAEHAEWWKEFWSRTFVYATSADGLADYIEAVRCILLYNMAASSRGDLPPKFNGMIFNTAGDYRPWGAQFWIWNTELMYFPLFAADAIDLTEPYFNRGVRDGIMDLAAIRGNVPLAIRAAEILGVDEDLRAAWHEFLDNLAPYPMGSDPGSKELPAGVLAENAWLAGHYVDVKGGHNGEQVWMTPVFQFEDYTLETEDDELRRIAERTYDALPRRRGFLKGLERGHWLRIPILAARMGRTDEMAPLLATSVSAAPYPNGYSLCGKLHSESMQPFGRTAAALQDALMQSLSPKPGEPEIIRIAPAWPKEWTATFRLLARGGFLVTSSIENGEVKFVEITSRLGEECRVRNPWGGKVEVRREGEDARQLEGDIIEFATDAGAQYLLLPAGAPKPKAITIKPQPAKGPISFEYKMESGLVIKRTLGLEASE